CVRYETATRQYLHYDGPPFPEIIRDLITGRVLLDCAIVVVSAQDGPMPQTRELVSLARLVGVQDVVVFLSKCDLGDDTGLIDLTEIETRQLLQRHGYLGDEVPVIRSNALAAVRSQGRDAAACACIDELVRALDGLPTLQSVYEEPFLMSIEGRHRLEGR